MAPIGRLHEASTQDTDLSFSLIFGSFDLQLSAWDQLIGVIASEKLGSLLGLESDDFEGGTGESTSERDPADAPAWPIDSEPPSDYGLCDRLIGPASADSLLRVLVGLYVRLALAEAYSAATADAAFPCIAEYISGLGHPSILVMRAYALEGVSDPSDAIIIFSRFMSISLSAAPRWAAGVFTLTLMAAFRRQKNPNQWVKRDFVFMPMSEVIGGSPSTS
jgi:hypothetical protein